MLFCLVALNAQAMQCAEADPVTNVLYRTTGEPPACPEYVLLTSSDYDDLRNPFNASPEFDTVLWAWGASVLLWVIGLVVGTFYRMAKSQK